MDDKTYKAQVTRVNRYITKWEKLFSLTDWKMAYDFERSLDKSVAGAECWPEWKYMQARIAYNMLAIEHMSERDLEHLVIHEFIHILLHEVTWKQEGDDTAAHEERATTALTTAIMKGVFE